MGGATEEIYRQASKYPHPFLRHAPGWIRKVLHKDVKRKLDLYFTTSSRDFSIQISCSRIASREKGGGLGAILQMLRCKEGVPNSMR